MYKTRGDETTWDDMKRQSEVHQRHQQEWIPDRKEVPILAANSSRKGYFLHKTRQNKTRQEEMTRVNSPPVSWNSRATIISTIQLQYQEQWLWVDCSSSANQRINQSNVFPLIWPITSDRPHYYIIAPSPEPLANRDFRWYWSRGALPDFLFEFYAASSHVLKEYKNRTNREG